MRLLLFLHKRYSLIRLVRLFTCCRVVTGFNDLVSATSFFGFEWECPLFFITVV